MTNLHNSTEEIWKDVPGYEGRYQASDLGRIRSLDRMIRRGNGRPLVMVKGKVMKPYPNRDGYLLIDLWPNTYSVHKVILMTFQGPKPKGMLVMHLNDKKDDNRLCNLKYGTYSENTIMAYRNNLLPRPVGKKGADNPLSKKVYQMTLDGTIINTFPSAKQASNITKVSQGSISNTCRGVSKTAGGFKWAYAN